MYYDFSTGLFKYRKASSVYRLFSQLPWRYMRADIEIAELRRTIQCLEANNREQSLLKWTCDLAFHQYLGFRQQQGFNEPSLEEFKAWQEKLRLENKKKGIKLKTRKRNPQTGEFETNWERFKRACSTTVQHFKGDCAKKEVKDASQNSITEKFLEYYV